MQADAGVVGEGDAGAGDLEVLLPQPREQRFVETPAQALAAAVGGDVDGDVGGPAVGGALQVAAGVGVTDHLSPVLGDEPRVGRHVAGHAGFHLQGIGRPLLEGDRRLLDVGGVDRRAGGGIALGLRVADDGRGHDGNLSASPHDPFRAIRLAGR